VTRASLIKLRNYLIKLQPPQWNLSTPQSVKDIMVIAPDSLSPSTRSPKFPADLVIIDTLCNEACAMKRTNFTNPGCRTTVATRCSSSSRDNVSINFESSRRLLRSASRDVPWVFPGTNVFVSAGGRIEFAPPREVLDCVDTERDERSLGVH
jgi:hypothetical protein